MGKILIITEKKSVAEDVAKAFGGGFANHKTYLEGDDQVISWAVGHLAELAAPEHYDTRFSKWRMADLPILPEHFDVVPRADGASAKKQLDTIEKLLRRDDLDLVVNACDAGREGELIFAYVLDVARPDRDLPVERAWFSSMTRQAIREAFGHLRPGDELGPLQDAARSRSEADWLVGMNATRAATVKARASLGGVVSLGRVQTPTLAILVKREKEIQAFRPTPYWVVEALFEPDGRQRYRGRWFSGGETRIPEAAEAERIAGLVRGRQGTVAELTKRVQRQAAPLLYDLTALQREAASWHGFTARRTLSAAQGCYEKAVLTYPRTSSRYLPSDMVGELREIAGHVGRRGPQYREAAAYVAGLAELPLKRVVNDAKVTDHHAVVPTNASHEAELSADEQRIYDMVARRFLAAFHPEAVFENTTVITEVESERFRSKGKVLLEAGWRAAYGELPAEESSAKPGEAPEEDEGSDQDLPALQEQEPVLCAEAAADARETKPPPRYGEASLLAAMEGAGKLIDDDELRDAMKESGIGTPATRAAIIERLIDVGYVAREGRRLVATQKGVQVIDLLDGHELTSPELTGRWERRLLDIERGSGSRSDFMQDIAQFTDRTVAYLRDLPPEKTRFQRRDLDIECPRCGKGHLIENRRGYGCSTWQSPEEPGCGFVVWKTIAGKQITEDVLRDLLENRRTKELAGFRSRNGRPFRAMLVLDPTAERAVSFEFKPRPQRGEKRAEQDEEPLAG